MCAHVHVREEVASSSTLSALQRHNWTSSRPARLSRSVDTRTLSIAKSATIPLKRLQYDASTRRVIIQDFISESIKCIRTCRDRRVRRTTVPPRRSLATKGPVPPAPPTGPPAHYICAAGARGTMMRCQREACRQTSTWTHTHFTLALPGYRSAQEAVCIRARTPNHGEPDVQVYLTTHARDS